MTRRALLCADTIHADNPKCWETPSERYQEIISDYLLLSVRRFLRRESEDNRKP
jgi:hypothetical protein